MGRGVCLSCFPSEKQKSKKQKSKKKQKTNVSELGAADLKETDRDVIHVACVDIFSLVL